MISLFPFLLMAALPSKHGEQLAVVSCASEMNDKLTMSNEDLVASKYRLEVVYVGSQNRLVEVERTILQRDEIVLTSLIPLTDDDFILVVDWSNFDPNSNDKIRLPRLSCELATAYGVKFHGWQFFSGNILKAGSFSVLPKATNAQTH